MVKSNIKDNPNVEAEKIEWMKSAGIKEFPTPPKYYFGDWVVTEEYIKNTPLEKLQEEYKKQIELLFFR